ncbi:hypothetical protein C1645_829089 [Glomus cerebriforme]|uniref:Uncharacterized protein n=1 Tax=Glomus cerebriforme TaxID=658196 RepID=A0A397SPP2_9GLOM|nr:hypothetical protein C1645_829089 [Glomus cerebriforme]
MASNLPYLCLRKVFKFLSNDNNDTYISRRKNIHSCVLVNRYWCKVATPFLWKEPFTGSLNPIKSINLVNVLITNFSEQELQNLNLNFIIQHNQTTFDYIIFIRTLIVKAVIEATSYWLRNNKIISKENLITNYLLKQILLRTSNLEHIISNSNINIFQFPISKNYFSNLIELTGFDENINGIYSSISNIAENIRILRFSLTNNHIMNHTTTINDISKIIKKQKNLERFSIDNRLSCYCCPKKDFLSLDFTKIFDSLILQSNTLNYIGLYDIDFFFKFPLNQLNLFKNLNHLEIIRCYNFGQINNFDQIDLNFSFKRLSKIIIYYSFIPSNILKLFFLQSGRNLKKVKLVGNEVIENFYDIIQICINYNPNLTHFLSFIHSKEIFLLPKFLISCQNLLHFEIWDINYSSNNNHHHQLLDEKFDVNDLLIDLSNSIPNSLLIFNINMNWSFSTNYFKIFLLNLQSSNIHLDYLGFPFCSNFNNDHLNIILNYLKFPLKCLNIRNANNILYDDVERSCKIIKNLVVPNNIRRFVEYDKYFFDIINQTSF